MPANVDQVADVASGGVQIYRLAKLYDFPDFVKSASEQNLLPATVPNSAYADPVHRQFRCDTRASTWLSALFYQEKRSEFHPKERLLIEKNLDNMVRYWRIKEAIDVMRSCWQELHKTAEAELPDSMFAYVWVDTSGHKDRHLPLRTRMEVKAASDWLFEYRDRIPFSDRHVIASKILEKAAEYGAGLGQNLEFVERQAGRGVPAGCEEIVDMVQKRGLLTKNAALKEHFQKMASTIKAMPRKALLPATLIKLAETIDILDRQMGLVGKYGEELRRPEDVIFKATFCKVAEDLHHHVATTSGKVYEKQAFGKLALVDVQALFGDDFADRVRTGLDLDPEKMAEEAATLPRSEAEMLDGLLSEHGVQPVLTKAASARQGLTPEEMNAWAQAYQTSA